ncbi:MAG: BamA/TamA family outer membrane protein [Bacteroidales bacterium]|nr:BamA/TamA family outer membrane protein [Bacteroidales bacterium]
MGRYIPKGEHVLHSIELDLQMADSSDVPAEVKETIKDAKNYYSQRPNIKVFGIKWLPVAKWLYCFMTDTNSNMWNNYMHRLGEAPVVYDEALAVRTATQLQGLMQSRGCFQTEVSFDTLSIRRRNINLCFHLKASPRYHIDEVTYHTSNPDVARLLEQWKTDSPIKAGEAYNQAHLVAERTRLVSNLREMGYYLANTECVHFVVDTTYDRQHLTIDVEVDATDLNVYHINNIYIYPNSNAGIQSHEISFDTLIYTYPTPRRQVDFHFVYNKPISPSPRTISRAMMLFPGMTYRPRHVSTTYNSLIGLRNFKYINIDFAPSPSSTDSLPLIDAHVRLIPAVQQRMSFSLELTNASPLGTQSSGNFFSNGNLGLETAVEYQHKNLFGGAELLKVKGSLLFELSKLSLSGGTQGFYNNFSAFESGIDLSLDMPTFLLPFASTLTFQRIKPHTLVSLGGSYQYRYYFERVLASTSFGYLWNQNSHSKHQLLPVEVTFVRMLNLDEDFTSRLRQINDLRLKYQYSSHFILDARYDFTYSNQQYGIRQHFTALHFSLESAGLLLQTVGRATHLATDTNAVIQMFGVPFSQYVRLGAELTHYQYVGTKSSLVGRLLIGAGLPYGNSLSMPYEKSFFGGGPTTLRAWQLRHLGPGSYNSSTDLLERVGDLQLVINLEARFPIVGILEGALFSDMGNVWLFHSSSQYEGGEIKWSSIPSEVAVGVGLGLRLNVSIATVRLDFALPLYDPGFATSFRWRPPHWNINQSVLNFGINYPF